jgi:hypothetical protein
MLVDFPGLAGMREIRENLYKINLFLLPQGLQSQCFLVLMVLK